MKAISTDVVIVGAGGAGLSLLIALDTLAGAWDVPIPNIVVVDPVHRAGPDRTWCYWEHPSEPVGGPAVAALAHHRWSSIELRDRFGDATPYELDPWRYVMVRSADFYAAAEAAASRLGVVRVTAPAGPVRQDRTGVDVAAGDHAIRGRWAFDSRPAPPLRPARTALLQHFRGWTVRFPSALVDPSVATFMDFSVPQPPNGVAFAYCLPIAADRALVEYTEFSPSVIPGDAYDAALTRHLRERWGLGREDVFVEEVETGVIPMTDAVHQRQEGRHLRLGTAGGATRPATGYTFAAMQRQAGVLASALVAGEEPVVPRPYPRRHAWMDAVLLRALDRSLTPAPDLFLRLFAHNPPSRVLRFLDGATSVPEEVAVMASCPPLPMMRAAVSLVRG